MSESAVRACSLLKRTMFWTDPSILQHKRSLCQLLSRFSPNNHGDSHYREVSLEKVTVLNFKRRRVNLRMDSKSSKSACPFTKFPLFVQAPGECCIAARICQLIARDSKFCTLVRNSSFGKENFYLENYVVFLRNSCLKWKKTPYIGNCVSPRLCTSFLDWTNCPGLTTLHIAK